MGKFIPVYNDVDYKKITGSEKHPDGADASKCKQFISTTLDQEEENIEEDFYNDEDCIDDLLSMID